MEPSSELGSHEELLRIIVAVAIDRETAAWCLGHPGDATVARWPSTPYHVLARAALQSVDVWRRTATILDRTLHHAMRPYARRSVAEIMEAFALGRDSFDGEELAALLWCLFRRSRQTDDLAAERKCLELRVVATHPLRLQASS